MNDLDTFEGWLEDRQMDLRGVPDVTVAALRAQFESDISREQAAPSAVLFNQPCLAGEYRYAVTIKDGEELRLLRTRRLICSPSCIR